MTYTLQKGENIALNTIQPLLNELIIATKWLSKQQIPDLEIDASAFLLTDTNKVSSDADFIFYNQTHSLNKAVIFKNNFFKIDLNAIHSDISRIAFTLSIHQAKERQQSFALLDKVMIKVFHFHSKQELIHYDVELAGTETAIISSLLYRHHHQWKFKAIGQGYQHGLDILAKNFGVDIETEQTHKTVLNNPPTPENNAPVIKEQTETTLIQTATPQKKSKNKRAKNKKPAALVSVNSTEIIDNTIDIFNTKSLTVKEQYQPIEDWFNRKFIAVTVNEAAMDTTGFFDELAVALGDDFTLLKTVSYNIKRRQLQNKGTAYIEMSAYNSSDADKIKKFCKELYEYSFVAKYFYNQKDKKIALHLQSATRIVQFFNGEWLEWFAFMKIAAWCQQKQKSFSCVRNMHINFLDSSYEIDVFFLIDNKPLFIECKSGEYRAFIDKYSKLRKNLAIEKPYFLFLTSEVDEAKAQGLTATFEITFINPTQLIHHIESLF
ncbi:MAG: TerD family protein [Methylococcaceae bacterium]